MLEGGLVVPVGVPVAVVLDAQIYGLAFIGVKQVGQDLCGGHLGIAIRIGDHAILQVPAELTSIVTINLGIAVKGQTQDLVTVALAPLGEVLVHVLVGQLIGLAVLVRTDGADLHTGTVGGVGGGVHKYDGAILAGAKGDPHMAVHGEDVARLELMALIDAAAIAVLIDPRLAGGFIHQHIAHIHGAPALIGSEDTSLLGSGHHVTLVVGNGAVLGVHQVVDRPANIAGAVNTSVVVLVPGLMGVVALTGVGILVVVVLVLTLEEVDPALRQADGHGLVGGVHILPIPGAAIDVQGSAHRLHSGSQEVLQGQLAGHAADRGGVVLGHEHPEQLGHMVIRVHHDADGIVYLQLIERDFRNSGSAGLSVDVIKFGVIVDGEGLVINIDAVAVGVEVSQNTGHVTLFHLGGGDRVAVNGDVVDIALLELVLDLELAAVSGDGELFFRAVHKEAVNKVFFVLAADGAVALNSQVDNILTGCPQGGGFVSDASTAKAGTARDDSMDAERSRAQSFFFIRCTFLSRF